MTGKPSNRDRAALLRQQLAAAAGGSAPRNTTQIPSINIDKRRITLPRLRFMGEEPHPSQLAMDDELGQPEPPQP